ncbi:MAG: LysO family transporter [Firmicutes bacterium]|nr:LysO family transporter [Bacillota bacterium]
MSTIFLALGAGFLVGLFGLVPKLVQDRLHYLSTGALILLIYTLGAKLGSDRKLMADISRLGLESIGLALSGVAGSLLLVFVYEKQRKARRRRAQKSTKEVQEA